MSPGPSDHARLVDDARRLAASAMPALPLALLDEAGRLVAASPGAREFLGDPVPDSTDQDAFRQIHPEDQGLAQEAWMAALADPGVPQTRQIRSIGKGGVCVWVEYAVVNLLENPDVAAMAVRFRDVTDLIRVENSLRRAEDQIRQAQKMEAMGRLAAGVAHDFNNLLTVISGYAGLIAEVLPEQHEMRGAIEEIINAADRAAALTRQLLAFSRRQQSKTDILDLNEVVSADYGVLSRLVGDEAELLWQPGVGLWPIQADRGQLTQIVLNLVVNARDAVAGGGCVLVTTENVTVSEQDASSLPAMVPGPYVRLKVTDTGCGMDEATLARIFEPFFTTKDARHGSGLGLSTVYGIVKAHGGFIYAASRPGQGTTLSVYLPPVDGTPTGPDMARGKLPRGTETILLVEPSDDVRGLARRVLQYCGYTTLDARTATEAAHLFAEHSQRVRLVICDLCLSGKFAPCLVDEFRRNNPELRYLGLSGDTNERLTQAGISPDDPSILRKPFTPAELAVRVRRALDG